MAKQNVFGGKSKKFVFLFLSMVACVLSSLGVISASIQEATPVSATAPTVERDCIGITFVDENTSWTIDGSSDPYIFIYSDKVSAWADESPFSSVSAITGFSGVSYDSSEGALRVNATFHGWKWGQDNHREYTLQIPWVIKSCQYIWKRTGSDENFTDQQSTVNAGHTYTDYLTGWGGEDNKKGLVSHVTDPGTDNLASYTWSGDGTTVTEYAVIDGVYNAEKIITTSDVIQNSIYTVSESSNIGSTITFSGDTYLLDGYYTNSTLTSSTVTSVNVGTNESYDLFARLVTPAVYFMNGSNSGWGSIWDYPKMTTSDGGLTYSYTWTVSSLSDDGGLFKICDRHTASTSWCGTYVSGSNKVSASGDNFVVSATGTYTVVYTVSGNTFTVHEPAATVDVYYVVCGVKGATRDTTRAIYPNEPIAVFADIDPDDIGYDSDTYFFTGWYFEYDSVLGVNDEWTSAHSFSSGDAIYAGFEMKSDELSEGVYLVNGDTDYDSKTHVPKSGKMYYKTGSGCDASGSVAPTAENPFLYYITMTFSVNDTFCFFDNEHYDGNSRPILVYYSGSSILGDFFTRDGNSSSPYSYTGTVCGYMIHQIYRCLIAGTYTIYYGCVGTGSATRGIYNVVDSGKTSEIYFHANGASWANVYCYMYNSTTKLPAGGSAAWPGCAVGDTSNDMRVTVTRLVKTKHDTQNMSFIYKVTYYPLEGNPNCVIFNDGTSDGSERVGYEKTGNLDTKAGSGYIFRARGTGQKVDYLGTALGWLYDFESELGTATYEGRTYTDSICAIINDSTKATSFYNGYAGYASNIQTVIGNATIETYTNVEEDNTTTGTVAFTTIIAMLAEVVGGGASARISAPGSASSPLTVTLWIVLGSGSIGIGLILGAYLVSKKKKKHRA